MTLYSYYKILFISIVIVFIWTVNLPMAFSQIFSSEQNPPGVKWMQINTPNFQILYPTGLENEGQRMANTLEHLTNKVAKSLQRKPRKITVILQNQGVISNGFVQLAPRRSEFFTTPPQNFDVQDWLNSLAVHELRHVVQFDKLTGNLKAPFFEELALAIFGITLPPWFFEGDAVGIETSLSEAGRGRLPDWEQIFKTNTLSTKKFTYSKNYLGSLKALTPGYYQLGYFMTTKLRRDYGPGILDSVMSRISANPFRPYNLSNSIKKFTGLTTRQLHDSTVNELKVFWEAQTAKSNTRDYPVVKVRKNKVPVDYLFPVRSAANQIIALRRGFDKTPVIVRLDDQGNEDQLIKIGFQTEPNFSYASGKLVWDEFRYDARFQKRSFNVINIYDIAQKQSRQLTHRSRLFSPALSPDGNKIAAVKVGLNNVVQLVELNASDGKELNSFEAPTGVIIQTPSYRNDGKKIIAVAVGKDGASLIEFDIDTKRNMILAGPQRQQITRPVYAGTDILFRAHFNGSNNIYKLTPTAVTYQLTSARYGASNPSYSEITDSYLFNNFQTSGYDIAELPASGISEVATAELSNLFINYAAPLVIQENTPNVFDSIPKQVYATKRYREVENLFYFHSLTPIVEENEFSDELNIGLKVKSANKLNTMDFYAGYQFNNGLRRSEYIAGLTYKRYFPIFDLSYVNRARLSSYRQTVGGVNQVIPLSWRENHTEFKINIPVVANRLNKTFTTGFNLLTSYTSRYDIVNRPNRFIQNIRFPLGYQFYVNSNSQRSARDLAPRWGQSLRVSYESAPFQETLTGKLFSVQSSVYTPGLVTNHSFRANFNYQDADGSYRFNVDIPRVTGYASLRPTAQPRNTLLLDYRMPLFYPDAEIGPLAYVKRIKGGLFADFENLGKGNPFSPRTYGIELSADMNILRFYLPEVELTGRFILVNESGASGNLVQFGFNYGF